nr:MAG TPA: hypothetical protein [Caudoviricetes sp.]DAK89241.1 MAG TPA: hypothetical protein [Caudoviricetes sp.]
MTLVIEVSTFPHECGVTSHCGEPRTNCPKC